MDSTTEPQNEAANTPKPRKLTAITPASGGQPSPRLDTRGYSATSSPAISNRSSFIEPRGYHSPHNVRDPFVSQSLQSLNDNPPPGPVNPDDAKFAGRDWRSIAVGEIVAPEETRFVQTDTSVEETSRILTTSGAPNVVLIREEPNTRVAVGAFDYDDLIAYLLLVTNAPIHVEASPEKVRAIIRRSERHEPIPLEDVKYLLGRKEPPAFLDHNEDLTKAVELFGSGFHRIIVRKQGTEEVVGILSQLRLVRFLYENFNNYGAVQSLNLRSLHDLDAGNQGVVSINGDQPLKDALLLMHNNGITSLPVLDSHKNVIGNISHVDANLLTTTAALEVLDKSCSNFIRVILSERGMNDGKDSYPIFHVYRNSTLAYTVAKLVATRSHRMWIVAGASPHASVPPSPSMKASPSSTQNFAKPLSLSSPTVASPLSQGSAAASGQAGIGSYQSHSSTQRSFGMTTSPSFSPYSKDSGKITGVVSLTDVLNLYARASGLSPANPEEARRRRRTSSSSSLRQSIDGLAINSITGRRGVDLSSSYSSLAGSDPFVTGASKAAASHK